MYFKHKIMTTGSIHSYNSWNMLHFIYKDTNTSQYNVTANLFYIKQKVSTIWEQLINNDYIFIIIIIIIINWSK